MVGIALRGREGRTHHLIAGSLPSRPDKAQGYLLNEGNNNGITVYTVNRPNTGPEGDKWFATCDIKVNIGSLACCVLPL